MEMKQNVARFDYVEIWWMYAERWLNNEAKETFQKWLEQSDCSGSIE